MGRVAIPTAELPDGEQEHFVCQRSSLAELQPAADTEERGVLWTRHRRPACRISNHRIRPEQNTRPQSVISSTLGREAGDNRASQCSCDRQTRHPSRERPAERQDMTQADATLRTINTAVCSRAVLGSRCLFLPHLPARNSHWYIPSDAANTQVIPMEQRASRR